MKNLNWKLAVNFGDAFGDPDPLHYGGYYIKADGSEVELLTPDDGRGNPSSWTIHQFRLDRCTDIGGVLSDNPFHPEIPAWFAADIDSPAGFANLPNLRALLCSADPADRARGYMAIGDYHGFENLDQYPLILADRAEVEARYGS